MFQKINTFEINVKIDIFSREINYEEKKTIGNFKLKSTLSEISEI